MVRFKGLLLICCDTVPQNFITTLLTRTSQWRIIIKNLRESAKANNPL